MLLFNSSNPILLYYIPPVIYSVSDYLGADKKRNRDDIPAPQRKPSLSAIPPHISGHRNRPQPSLLSIVEVRSVTIIVNIYLEEASLFYLHYNEDILSPDCLFHFMTDHKLSSSQYMLCSIPAISHFSYHVMLFFICANIDILIPLIYSFTSFNTAFSRI